MNKPNRSWRAVHLIALAVTFGLAPSWSWAEDREQWQQGDTIRQPVVATHGDRGRFAQAAVPDQFHAVTERHDGVCRAVQDNSVGLDRRGRTPPLPSWTEQDQRRAPGVDVHGHGTTTGTADHHVGLPLVEFGLADGSRPESGRAMSLEGSTPSPSACMCPWPIGSGTSFPSWTGGFDDTENHADWDSFWLGALPASWGPNGEVQTKLEALDAAGVFVSAAAGNRFWDFNSNQGLAYPAISPHTVSVGAVGLRTRGPLGG